MNEEERKRLEAARIAEGERSFEVMARLSRRLQAEIFDQISDYIIDTIEVDDTNRIKFSRKNLGSVQDIFKIFRSFGSRFRNAILDTFIKRADKVFDLNDRYFETFADVKDIREAARLETLLRWGYNAQTKKLIAGGYLDSIFKLQVGAGQRVAGLVNQAIASKMSLKDFRLKFKLVFVGRLGAGMLESDFNRATFDLFQQIDRSANLIYADRLGLNDAIYSGTIMKEKTPSGKIKIRTRPFCVERVNKIFSREEIEAWANEDFAGKTSPIYDPYINCGGYNCRHHLSFVTPEVAEVLRKRQNKG